MESAGIRRQTFIITFFDKYELLDWIFENDLTEYITNNLDFISGQKLLQELFFISEQERDFYIQLLIFKGKITSMTTLSATVASFVSKNFKRIWSD